MNREDRRSEETPGGAGRGTLSDVRVVEIGDETGEYCGLVLAGLGADVVKVEPPGGSASRHIGPFYQDQEDPEKSLFFWQYNRGKRSIVLDPADRQGRDRLHALLSTADVLLNSLPREEMVRAGLSGEALLAQFPSLIMARLSPFGDTGPWADYKSSDLVQLALGGVMMNCGYDPLPEGTYDQPPIAPQMWHSIHIAGEQLAMAIVAGLTYRYRTGKGQILSCAMHDAVSKCTEADLMSWVMLHTILQRQTCRHAHAKVFGYPSIVRTKDGRCIYLTLLGVRDDARRLLAVLKNHNMASDMVDEFDASDSPKGTRFVPGTQNPSERQARLMELLQRLVRKYSYDNVPWKELQEAGLCCAPLRKPHENVLDEHWQVRGSVARIEHPEVGRALTYPSSKWVSTAPGWVVGQRAPLLNEHAEAVMAPPERVLPLIQIRQRPPVSQGLSARGKPFVLENVRILDFGWFLASAGGTRFLAAMGAESIKVELKSHPDTRLAAMAPVGGRAAREKATGPLEPVTDPDMGGQFNNKNPGKRGISLNVRHPKGLQIAKRLVAMCDIVAEGFSPGVMHRWGLGYDALRSIRPDIIYAQQSGMGSKGSYGRMRTVGPVAAAFAGLTDMSGLPEPADPVGWGYSYLDWMGAYSFGLAILGALFHRERTGEGQFIDASQCECGIYIPGTAILDFEVNGRVWRRYGNRSPYKPAAPHGAYPCAGVDRWLAISCFTEEEFRALALAAGHREWLSDPRFSTLSARLAHQDALDALVSTWTRTQGEYAAMTLLQSVGVPAGVCQTAEDRCDHDPQLAHLDWLTEVTGTKIGRWPVAEVAVKMSETPPYIGGRVDRGAPCYGEDNEYVYGELLGMSTREIAALAEEGVL